jgi:hypothetical protein
MTTTILDTVTLETEIVLSERRVTTEFVVRQIQEDIRNRRVQAEIELGPFTTETYPGGREETRGSGQRGVTVWEGDAYDAVRDTWDNAALMAKLTEILNG